MEKQKVSGTVALSENSSVETERPGRRNVVKHGVNVGQIRTLEREFQFVYTHLQSSIFLRLPLLNMGYFYCLEELNLLSYSQTY